MVTDALKTKSWQTTGAGVTTILTALCALVLKPLFDGDDSTTPMWAEFIPVAMSGVVGLFARDNNKSSEQVIPDHK